VIDIFTHGPLDQATLAMLVEGAQASVVMHVAEDAGIHHVYQNLLGFIQDYQNKQAGWPTVAMNVKIGNCDHEFDFETPPNTRESGGVVLSPSSTIS
jgi:hypothetical protein